MRTWLRIGELTRVWLMALSLVGIYAAVGGRTVVAQTVTTTNEVRAMRGLGPIPEQGSGVRDQGSGVALQLPTVAELEG